MKIRISRSILRAGAVLTTVLLLPSCGQNAPVRASARDDAPADAPLVWIASSLHRPARDEKPGGPLNAALSAGRGEYEAFQIVIHAPGAEIPNVDVTVSDLTGLNSAVIGKENITLYREHFVYVGRNSPDSGFGNTSLGVGWYADALIPFSIDTRASAVSGDVIKAVPFNVPANQNQTVWVDVRVPPDSSAGMYSGTATVTSDRGNVTVPISLTVWRFVLPLKPTLKSSFGVHAPTDSDRSMQELLLRHKLMPTVVDPAKASGLVRRFGLNTTALRQWSGASRHSCTMNGPSSPAVMALEAAKYPQDLDLYVYSADEIDPCTNLFGVVKAWGRAIHQANPRIRNLATMTPTPALMDDGGGKGRSAVDTWVVAGPMYEAAPEMIASAIAKGDEIWSYTAMAPGAWAPRWQIDFLPINYRIQPGFINQSLGLTGILYWRVELFTAEPWKDVQAFTAGEYAFPGEGMLVYPGREAGTDSFLPSMRLKYIRDGVEDFEYVQLLKAKGQGDWALALVRSVAPDWKTWTKDSFQLDAIRKQLGEELDRLTIE